MVELKFEEKKISTSNLFNCSRLQHNFRLWRFSIEHRVLPAYRV